MRITRLHIKNLNSLAREVEIDFLANPLAQAGLFAIVGDTGAGKSTLLDGITLALYGRIHRSKDIKEVLSYNTTECFSYVDFTVDEELFRAGWSMHRARNKVDGKLQPAIRQVSRWDAEKQAFLTLTDKIKEADLEVEQITGLDFSRFCKSVLLSQGDFAAFLRSSDRERSHLLERITGTEVYTALSKAAFDRHKEEQQKLQELQNIAGQIQLLSPAEVQGLEAELAENQKALSLQKQELDELIRKIQVLEKQGNLALRRQALKQEQQALEEIWEQASAKRSQLAAHRQALPFQRQLSEWTNSQEQVQFWQQKAESLQSDLEQLEKAQQTLQAKGEEHKQQVQDLEKDYQAQKPIWDKTLQLDQSLQRLQEKKQESDHLGKDILQQKQELSNQLQLETNRLQAAETDINTIQTWQQEHANLSAVEPNLKSWQDRWQSAQSLITQSAELEKQIAQTAQNVQQNQEQQTTLESQVEQLQTNLQEQAEALAQLEPGPWLEATEKLTDKLNIASKTLDKRKQLYKELLAQQQQYEKRIAAYEQRQNQIKALEAEDQDLWMHLANVQEQLQQAQVDLEYQQSLVAAQQLIVNYEKDRQKLVDGEPCPLCGSVHHPYLHDLPKPVLDRAEAEFKKQQAYTQKLEKEQQQLLRKHTEIGTRIQAIRKGQSEGTLEEEFQAIQQLEDKILQLNSFFELAEPAPSLDRTTWVAQHLEEESNRLAQLRKLYRPFHQTKNQLQDRKEALQKGAFQLQLLAQEQASKQQQLSQINTQIQELTESLKLEITPTGFIWNQAELGSQLSQWAEQLVLWKEKQPALEKAQLAVERHRTQIKALTTALDKNQSREEQWNQQHQTLVQEASVQKAERQTLLQNLDPQAEERKLQQAINLAKEELQATRTLFQEQQATANALLKQAQEAQKTASDKQATVTKMASQLQKELAKTTFSDLKALSEALLPAEQAQNLSQEIEKTASSRKINSAKQAEVEKDWALLQEQTEGWPPLPDLQDQLPLLQSQYDQDLQRQGSLQQQLQHHEKQLQQNQKVQDRISAQREIFTIWARMNELIGSADGKKFRAFAQGLTLERLVLLANDHLQRLSPRYLIQKSPSQDLEIEIIDTYQANFTRSMHTLSGGESFLVSLALALGLSDLASRRSNIQTLFIDEGFGALDEASLDLALSTLENLQATGKTIGLISHVPMVKERISVQIQVKKQGSGVSQVQIAG